VKKTGDQELIDIIKSANRVGVRDLKEGLRDLYNFIEKSLIDDVSKKLHKSGKGWLKDQIKDKLNTSSLEDHPVLNGVSNFVDMLNECDFRHGKDKQFERPDIESQRIFFDMGLTLARLKLQIMSEKDLKHTKNEE
jgi:hypothetical protein